MTPLLVGLTLAATLSPLLTFTHLFQLKEWRLDRLREHFRMEGWLRQLFGITRPALLGFFGCVGFLPFGKLRAFGGFLPSWPLAFLIATTLFNTTQIIFRKQPYPVWTKKAIVLVGTSLFITLFCGILVTSNEQRATSNLIVIIPLLQPFFLMLSWLLWKPIDYILKQRILARARTLRTQFPNLVVIGITGSAGKTTTKELLAHILGPDRAIATPEHVNTELGVAKWLIEILSNQKTLSERMGLVGPIRGGHDIGKEEPARGKPLGCPLAIVEMGAYREGEIATLCSITQPTMGIITSIGTQHIGLFGSQKAIAEAKGELFAALPPHGHAFVNSDTPFAQELQKKCACSVTTVSAGSLADFQATHTEETPEGLRFQIHTTFFTIPLHGEHQLGNVLLAVATATELGMTLENIAKKLRTFSSPPHTFSLREENGITILDDTHNASPESLSAAIEWARHQPYKKKILLSPGIIEQGRATARTHVRCGALAKEVFDEAYILNKKFAQYFEQGFCKPVRHILPPTPYPLPNTLLVCVGRIPQTTIQKSLP